jgi:SAM-dependent methyltransferase
MEAAHMRDFWNARAREDAYFFVDDRRAYGDTDLERFWADGERDLDRILESLGVAIGLGDTALDIGCGVGRLTRVLAGRAVRVHALDVSSEMVELARRHHAHLTNVCWLVGDGVSLSGVPDTSVDACVSHVVFQHIPDPAITLGYVAEMGRVLRVGGWAAFQISNDERVHRAGPTGRARLARRMAGAGLRRGPRGRDDPAWLGSAVDLGDLRRVASQSGLELERVVGEGTQFCLVLARRVP